MIFVIIGLIYAIKGYIYYQDEEQLTKGSNLLSVLSTPFILALIRFFIVVCFGIFLSTTIIANPLRKIKVMQFEVEFAEKATEIAQIQDKQFNQLHFLERVLKENNHFIGKFFNSPIIPYKDVVEEIFQSYEEFFNDELNTNLHFELIDIGNNESFEDRRLNRMLTSITNPVNERTMIRNRNVLGNNLLMLYQQEEEYNKEFCILLSSSEYEFTDYDIKIIQSLLETSRIICDNISLFR